MLTTEITMKAIVAIAHTLKLSLYGILYFRIYEAITYNTENHVI